MMQMIKGTTYAAESQEGGQVFYFCMSALLSAYHDGLTALVATYD
jgi:hypothetical protein